MRRKIILVTLFLLATVFINSVTHVAAEDLATHPVVAAYAEVFTVTEKEALRRLELQNEMMDLGNMLAEKESDYAGSWIQHEPEFRFFVAFTTINGEEILRKYLDSVTWDKIIEVEQVPHMLEQLIEIQDKISQARQTKELNTPFESGVSLRRQKVILYTPDPDSLRSQVDASSIKQHIGSIEFDFQETLSESSTFLDGGVALSTCTGGFVVRRHSDSRRFISTAGHCSNTQTSGGVNIGAVIFENNPDPTPPIGLFGRDMDFQTHDALAAGFDLRNVVQVNLASSPVSTENVVSYQYKGSTENSWVCKHGKTTNQTCGTVTNIYYAPTIGGVTFPARYVRVDRPNWASYPMSCPGDSGGSVYLYATGGASGLGINKGSASTPSCNSGRSYFYYTPVDEINRAGYNILISGTHLYQHVFWSPTSCTEYKTILDGYGDPQWWSTTSQSCSTYAPGSGPIESYTTYVHAGELREAMWRNGIGYVRDIPLYSNGRVNWGAAPDWTDCCVGNGPSEQGAYVLGEYLFQHVFWSPTSCTEYKTPFNSSGDPQWGSTTSQSCSTYAPGSGPIESYTTFVSGGYLREAMWRNGIGYTRNIPLIGNIVNWGAALDWTDCCVGNGPSEQGAYMLTHSNP